MKIFELSTTWFDYVYYRLCLVYRFFRDPEAFSAIIIVSMIKTLLISDCVLAIILVIMKVDGLNSFSSALGSAAALLFFVCFYFDWRHYKNRFQILHNRWSSETSALKMVKSLLVVITVVVPWIPPILFAQR
jgi:arginine exporter protein ArgO